MPRKFTFRSFLTAVTVAVVSLCGGVKTIAAQKGVTSVLEAPTVQIERQRHSDHLGATTEVAAVESGAGELGIASADRAVIGGLSPLKREPRLAQSTAVDAHQLREFIVCVRPPTRGPPEQSATG